MTFSGISVFNKWLLRTRKGPDITVDANGFDGLGEDIIKRWQKEFQQDFCPSCVHFDPVNQTFKKKEHPNNPEQCYHHWTDIVGVCWGFKERDTNRDISNLIWDEIDKEENDAAKPPDSSL